MGNREDRQGEPPLPTTIEVRPIPMDNRGDAINEVNKEINAMRMRVSVIDSEIENKEREIRVVAPRNVNKALELTGDVNRLKKERSKLQTAVQKLSSQITQVNDLKMTVKTQQHSARLTLLTRNLMDESGLEEMEEMADEKDKTDDRLERLNYFIGTDGESEAAFENENRLLLDRIMSNSESQGYVYPESTTTSNPVLSTTTTTTTTQNTPTNTQQKQRSSVFSDIYAF